MFRSKTVPPPERLLLTLGRLLACLPTPQAMPLLGALATVLPTPTDTVWTGAARRRVWCMRGEALWAARQDRVALCRILHFEGWEHLHQATERGRGVLFVGIRPAGWEPALLALGRYGNPVTLVTSDAEDDLLLENHRQVGNVLARGVLRQGLGSVCAAFLGIAGENGGSDVPIRLEAALTQGAAVVPLFSYREGRGWRLMVWQPAVFEEKTTSKKEQALQWAHRICMQAAEAEARRLPDDWSWQTRS